MIWCICGNNHTMKNTQTTSPSITPCNTSEIKNLPSQNVALAKPSCEEQLYDTVSVILDCMCDTPTQDVVIVCFGTCSISGDSLGPKIGTLLREKHNLPAFVYGTQEDQINGKNMKEWLSFITAAHKDALFISVDASLGSEDKVGQIIIRDDGVCPSGVTGKKERFGDIGILGVVAQKQGDAIIQLLSVSPLYIDILADKICNLLNCALG